MTYDQRFLFYCFTLISSLENQSFYIDLASYDVWGKHLYLGIGWVIWISTVTYEENKNSWRLWRSNKCSFFKWAETSLVLINGERGHLCSEGCGWGGRCLQVGINEVPNLNMDRHQSLPRRRSSGGAESAFPICRWKPHVSYVSLGGSKIKHASRLVSFISLDLML